MKKFLAILLVYLFAQINILAQEWEINFLTDPDTIKIPEHIIDFPYKIEYQVKKLSDSASDFKFSISNLSHLSAQLGSDFSIPNSNLELIASDYATGVVKNKSFEIVIKKDAQIEENEFLILEFIFSDISKAKSDTKSVLIAIQDPKNNFKFDEEEPFRIAIGANFDFLDGIKSTNLYSELTFTNRSILSLKKSKWRYQKRLLYVLPIWEKIDGEHTTLNFGLNAGYYQNRSFGIPVDIYLRNGNYITAEEIGSDSTEIFFNSLSLERTYKFDNLGLHFSPTLELLNRLNPESQEVFNIQMGIHFEVVRRNRTTNINYKESKLDSSLVISNDSLITAFGDFFPKPESQGRSFSETRYDRYYGLSFPLFYSNKKAEFEFKFATGFGIFGFSDFSPSNNNWTQNLYYITQFRIIEKKFGIQLSGDFRGFYHTDNYNNISISLSKLFDLSKLLSYQ